MVPAVRALLSPGTITGNLSPGTSSMTLSPGDIPRLLGPGTSPTTQRNFEKISKFLQVLDHSQEFKSWEFSQDSKKFLKNSKFI